MGRSPYLPILMLSTASMLAACGGAGNTDNQDSELPIIKAGTPENGTIDYDEIVVKQATGRRLAQISDEKFAHLMRNTVRRSLETLYTGTPYWSDSTSSFGSWSTSSSSSSSFTSASSASSVPGNNYDGEEPYSDLNVRVDGVDEPDLAKYDGRNWYFLTTPQDYQFGDFNLLPTLQVANLNPTDADAEITQAFELPAHWFENTQLYLLTEADGSDTEAAVVAHHSNGMTANELRRALAQIGSQTTSELKLPINGQTEIRLYKLDPSDSESLDYSIKVDGSLVESRKVGDTLYLVSRFTPWLDGLYNGHNNPDLMAANEKMLTEATAEQLAPVVHIDGQSNPINQRCWVETGLQPNHSAPQFIYITSIDLREGTLIDSTCYAGSARSMLFTLNSVYFAEQFYQSGQYSTPVHKFSVTPEVSYRASGQVQGKLEQVENPEYLMDEYQDDLRIITTNSRSPLTNYLTILEENPDTQTLEMVSQIPNNQRPAPIGKPNERVYSARFEEDKAYIVTFRRTDPLYSIDLSDRTDPKVTGELTIPGYATYMHPVGDSHLFYFGMNTDSNGFDLGLKAELVEVSAGDPSVVSSILIGGVGSKSEAIGNYRAISIVGDGDSMKFAIPVELFEDRQWEESGIKLLEVTNIDSDAAIHNRGHITTATPETTGTYTSAQARLRSIIHGDSVFAMQNDAIWASFWDTPEDAKGPIVADLDTLLAE